MREVTVKVYEYSELSPEAKEKAREWYRELVDSSDYEVVIEDADRMAAILGIRIDRRTVPLMGGSTRQDPAISWQLGYMQSDGVWIEGFYDYAKGSTRAIRAEAPQDATLHDLADELKAIQQPYQYQLSARFKDDDRRGMDLDLEHPTREVDAETYKQFRDIIRRFESWVYEQLRIQDSYLSSEEYLDEAISANEFVFTEQGRRSFQL